MTFVEANKIAHEFASSFGEIVIGFKYGYNDLKEYSTKYYADFCFLTLDGKIPNEPPLVGDVHFLPKKSYFYYQMNKN